MSAATSWEQEAGNWIAWARTPGHDVFPSFAPAFLDEVVPAALGLTLEVGCGEGRVARELASRGHTVMALDASPTLARAAREADAESTYLVGDATTLPFTDERFQTVVAYNSLQTMAHLDDMARAVREAARVLAPSGRFCLCVAHPLTDVGRIKEPSGRGELLITGSYFERQRVNESVTKDGLEMTFHGWTYTLDDYARALEDAGFLIERVREPVPSTPDASVWRRVPLFLFVRAAKAAQ